MEEPQTDAVSFDDFVGVHEPRLRRALVAAYGPTDGSDASAAAFAYAWEHWERLRLMDNPAGYLYRVGQSRTRRRRTPRIDLPDPPSGDVRFEPGLVDALRDLTEHQRVAVLLVYGHAWTQREVGELLDITESTVRNHLRRGIGHLRDRLGVELDA